MGNINDYLRHWPRNKKDEPIMKSSEDAIFYATLIHTNKILVGQVTAVYRKARKEVKEQCKKKGANLNKLYAIACKGQFARECLDEVQRLQDDTREEGSTGKISKTFIY